MNTLLSETFSNCTPKSIVMWSNLSEQTWFKCLFKGCRSIIRLVY